jgi:nickel-type superoxide dismutase maturation protease
MLTPPIRIFRVSDRSMEPAVKEGDYLIVSRWYRRLRVGDIVVLRHPTKNISIVKRISTVSSNSVHVIGDNKEFSEDSRKFGSLDMERVVGKVILRF